MPALCAEDSAHKPDRHGADGQCVTALDDPIHRTIDQNLHFGSLLVRAAVYGFVGSFASRYDCGAAMLTGTLLGDLAATVLRGFWFARTDLVQCLAEFAVFILAFFWLRAQLVLPDDQAQRAILGLAAFGIFAGRVGKTLLASFGRSNDGWS